jgi:hypothetical protein
MRLSMKCHPTTERSSMGTEFFCGQINRITDRALLCHEREGYFWIPKSAIIDGIDFEEVEEGDEVEFEYEDWFEKEYI